jgi:tRNA U34 5-methylaminomethyl-2-thiouridine-forming methyltransferase MnmC
MKSVPREYRLVRLANGSHSIRSLTEGETFHPVIGPVAEAEALYVKQLNLRERARKPGKFVIWDVGLGAAANIVTALRATRDFPCELHVVSFDHTLEALKFALNHVDELFYLQGYEEVLRELLEGGHVEFRHGEQRVTWDLCFGDFPTLLRKPGLAPPPHAIMYDAFSPAKNPEMWTAPLFGRLFEALDPARPCAMPTYSRSTMLRVTLLLAGFYVGLGHATGEKEETTIAANAMELISEPLPVTWLARARHSRSAEPMWEPVYRQSPLTAETWEKLRAHPQFRASQP